MVGDEEIGIKVEKNDREILCTKLLLREKSYRRFEMDIYGLKQICL